MTNFSTNWLLYTKPQPKKNQTLEESRPLPKAIQKKIQLIKKAFN